MSDNNPTAPDTDAQPTAGFFSAPFHAPAAETLPAAGTQPAELRTFESILFPPADTATEKDTVSSGPVNAPAFGPQPDALATAEAEEQHSAEPDTEAEAELAQVDEADGSSADESVNVEDGRPSETVLVESENFEQITNRRAIDEMLAYLDTESSIDQEPTIAGYFNHLTAVGIR